MEEQIKNQMHKAFWNLLEDDLKSEPQKFDHLMILIDEIKNKLKGFVPSRIDIHKEFDEIIDISFLKHLFDERSMDPSHFFKLIQFIVLKIKCFCAPYMDKDIKEWESELHTKMQSQIEYADFIPYFFKQTYIFIEIIEKDIAAFKRSTID
jgi:hypothetical protein